MRTPRWKYHWLYLSRTLFFSPSLPLSVFFTFPFSQPLSPHSLERSLPVSLLTEDELKRIQVQIHLSVPLYHPSSMCSMYSYNHHAYPGHPDDIYYIQCICVVMLGGRHVTPPPLTTPGKFCHHVPIHSGQPHRPLPFFCTQHTDQFYILHLVWVKKFEAMWVPNPCAWGACCLKPFRTDKPPSTPASAFVCIVAHFFLGTSPKSHEMLLTKKKQGWTRNENMQCFCCSPKKSQGWTITNQKKIYEKSQELNLWAAFCTAKILLSRTGHFHLVMHLFEVCILFRLHPPRRTLNYAPPPFSMESQRKLHFVRPKYCRN